MTSNNIHRRRVQAAINHQEQDRIPLTLGSPSCSLHAVAQANLLAYLNLLPLAEPVITDNILQIVKPDERLYDQFDIDLVWLLPLEAQVDWRPDKSSYRDYFGRQFVYGGGFFNQSDHPIKDNPDEEWDSYIFPDLQPDRFAHLGDQARYFFEKGYGLGIDGPWGIFEISSSLMGLTNFFENLVDNPKLLQRIAEDVLEKHLIPFYDRLLSETSQYVQIVGISDDLGSQTGLLFSPKLYRSLFKPLHRQLVEFIHKKTNAKVYLHSDGSILPLIPDFIEIGIEGLNPVQYSAKGMGLEYLKNTFGRDLGFFGGVIENQMLSFGSTTEIRKLANQNISILKPEGGFIFAPIHNISQEVPPENIVALYQAGMNAFD